MRRKHLGHLIRRNADGTVTLNLPGTQLQWNFGAQGLNYGDIAQIQVFAIEMVYVPQGAFSAGSGGTVSMGSSECSGTKHVTPKA